MIECRYNIFTLVFYAKLYSVFFSWVRVPSRCGRGHKSWQPPRPVRTGRRGRTDCFRCAGDRIGRCAAAAAARCRNSRAISCYCNLPASGPVRTRAESMKKNNQIQNVDGRHTTQQIHHSIWLVSWALIIILGIRTGLSGFHWVLSGRYSPRRSPWGHKGRLDSRSPHTRRRRGQNGRHCPCPFCIPTARPGHPSRGCSTEPPVIINMIELMMRLQNQLALTQLMSCQIIEHAMLLINLSVSLN